MLKNIHLHIHRDVDKQNQLEVDAAESLTKLQIQNISAFQRYIPALVQTIQSVEGKNISLLCNRFGELNIVDYGAGRVMYGFHPQREILRQVEEACVATPFFSLSAAQMSDEKPLPLNGEVLVVLGLGLGYHIAELVERCQFQHIIIYEPEPQYLRCSIAACDWKSILQTAQNKSIALYFQIGNNGASIAEDLTELRANVPVESCFLYKHYNQPVFDAIDFAVREQGWQGLHGRYFGNVSREKTNDVVPLWHSPLSQAEWHRDRLSKDKYEANLRAFKQYFPKIHDEFVNYTPEKWEPKANADGRVNVFHINKRVNLYSESPKQDAIESLNSYASNPKKDGLILGYTGKKLRHYHHYQLVERIEKLLSEGSEAQTQLPDKIRSMIMFGLGVGYQLEELTENYQVEKLFICEPNKDYFYASLYTLDWQHILSSFDEAGARLYINIGDDGTNLFNDLLSQFYTIGPYVLSHTYFYQGYYNEALLDAIVQLREQLQVMIAIGDYYDHAKFGIAHTRSVMSKNTHFLLQEKLQSLSETDRNVPVVIVGNGPSLDGLISTLHEIKEQAIIVSCGTALQVLYKNGLTPDFHAEIEQNRSTYDWASRIGNFDYLKTIPLISCNGVHPDTAALYQSTFLAFKEGESSTVSLMELPGFSDFAKLEFAFPTVTNFAVNLFMELRFNVFYLVGTDFGFVDVNNHHSKDSGYYDEQGNQTYDYNEDNNTAIRVPGNLRPLVNTKYEFKVAKSIVEQSLTTRKVDCYNLNDGAKVYGALPLHYDDVLIQSTAEDKLRSLSHVKSNCFRKIDDTQFQIDFNKRYNFNVLEKELNVFESFISKPVESVDDAYSFVDRQRDYLYASYQRQQSLLFFYFYGTVNFINSALMKAIGFSANNDVPEIFDRILDEWKHSFATIKREILEIPFAFDNTGSFKTLRRKACLQRWFNDSPFHIQLSGCKNSTRVRDVILDAQGISNNPHADKSIHVVFVETEEALLAHTENSDASVLCVTDALLLDTVINTPNLPPVVYLPGDFREPNTSFTCHDGFIFFIALLVDSYRANVALALPKLTLDPVMQQLSDYYHYDKFASFSAYEGTQCVLLSREAIAEHALIQADGARAAPLVKNWAFDTLMGHELPMTEQDTIKQNIQNTYYLETSKND